MIAREVRMKQTPLVAVALAALVGVSAVAQDHVHPSTTGERLGTVHFETSCTAREPFDRAVSLLHSFEFGQAISGFEATLKADPTCAMAEWGIALSRWSNPFAVGARSAQQLQQGLAAVERARAIGAKTD